MLKKLFKIGMVMSLLATTMTAIAQDDAAEFPRYNWKSNWSLGFGPVASWEMAQHSGGAWRKGLNAGAEIFMQHRRSASLSTRYRLDAPTMWLGMPDNEGKLMARYTTLTAEVVVSLTDWWKGYNPERRHSWYIFGGAGAAAINVTDWALAKLKVEGYTGDVSKTRFDNMGHIGVVLNGGLGYTLRFSDSWAFYTELEISAADLHPAFWNDFMDWGQTHGNFHIGVMKHFGLCEADKAIVKQKGMLTQENFDALNKQVSTLENQVSNARNNEKKLENRISQLEDQLKTALANQGKGGAGNSEEAKRLQATINQIKADQLNFYGMPFSVQYDVNEWKVSDEEMDKVKAVARVLKDNSDAKIMVVGFADHTGSDQYNMKLSEKRANEVKRLLTKQYGIAEDRISVDYKGKSVYFGDVKYALNRRVSFYRVID